MAAGFDTGITTHTDTFIPDNFVILQRKSFDRAGLQAITAVNTHIDRFRIVTETAVERTALKKDGHPVRWSIDIGKRNYPINGCCFHPDVQSCGLKHELHPEHLYQRP